MCASDWKVFRLILRISGEERETKQESSVLHRELALVERVQPGCRMPVVARPDDQIVVHHRRKIRLVRRSWNRVYEVIAPIRAINEEILVLVVEAVGVAGFVCGHKNPIPIGSLVG